MGKLIAVEGCTIDYDLPDDALGSVSLVTNLSAAKAKVSSRGNRAYSGEITISVVSGSVNVTTPPEGGTNPGTVPPGTIKISGSAQKSGSKGEPFVLQDDDGDFTFVCAFPASSGTGTVPGDVKIRATVTDAGQNVLKVT